MLAFQTQETPLQPSALHALDDLKKTTISQDRLQTRLNKAIELLTTAATEINDRNAEVRAAYHKKSSRLIANGEDEDFNGKQENEEYQTKVADLTKRMDAGIRRVIDDKIWLNDIPRAFDHIRRIAGNTGRMSTSTQITTQQSSIEMNVDADVTQPSQSLLLTPNPSETPSAVLNNAFTTGQRQWQGKSLTERYSEHNDYVGWYRMVYDAKHPGENPPPMPHASMWFAGEEGRLQANVVGGSQNPGHSGSKTHQRAGHGYNGLQSDEGSDVEIAAEKVRIRCPITLRPYNDPLASTKCPHAFEKSAIMDMLKHSTERMAPTAEQLLELSQITRAQDRNRREREMRTVMVRCPECSVPLTQKDLRPDPVLLRKVNRILDRERRAAEAEQRGQADVMDADVDIDDEDDIPKGTQRRTVVQLGSSPANALRQSGRVFKNERTSMSITATVNDDDEEAEGEEEEEEEEEDDDDD